MDWIEMLAGVECAFCGNETTEHFQFNMGCADQSGVNSALGEFVCDECNKKFWASAYLEFRVDVSGVYKRKPKK